MNKKIKEILNSLYAIDENFRNREKELVKILGELIKTQPDIKVDKKFVDGLRKELTMKTQTQTQNQGPKMPVAEEKNVFKNLEFCSCTVQKFAYFFGGVIASVLIILLVFSLAGMIGKKDIIKKSVEKFDLGKAKIAKISEKAFGALNKTTITPSSGMVPAPQSMTAPLGIGGGGMPGKESSMIAPEIITYKYIYKGEPISVKEPKMDVVKRKKDKENSAGMAQMFTGLDLGLINLNKLQNTVLSNFTLSEDREFGYSLYVNFIDNVFSLMSNYEKWVRPESKCQEQKCFDDLRLTASKVPSDEQIIASTNQFMKDYSIPTDNYGSPSVFNYWKEGYDLAADKTNYYIPETLSVIYPQKINNLLVYDQNGNPDGLYAEFNILYNKVSGVNNMAIPNYESSQYDTETDATKLIALAEKGGLEINYNYGGKTKTVEVEIGTPTIGLVKYWKYSAQSPSGEEFYVPAFIFPITKRPEGMSVYKKNIVVPIVKDFMEENQDIMPNPVLYKEGTAPAATGTEMPATESVEAEVTR